MADYKLITEPFHLRHYKVRAYLSKKTGAVLRIKCGCRQWKSIEEAIAHYAGGGRYAFRGWRWARMAYSTRAGDREHDFNQRTDAMLALARCAAKVYRYKKKLRRVKR